MKAKFLITCFSLTAALIYQSCDYVRNAVPSTTGSSTTGSSTTGGTTGIIYRKVLIEDYTGHKCGNCPAAARELRKLDSIYTGKIVPMAVHAGFYAAVTPASNPPYPTDFKSQAGTDFDTFFGNSLAGNPNGLVNRTGYGSASFIKQWSDWGTSAYSMMSMPADFKISISNTYNSSTNQVTTVVTTKAINTKTGIFNLVVVLTEDSIVAEQIDYSLPMGSQYVSNYEFNHVLRGAVNSTWGDQIVAASINANDSVVKTYSNFQLSAGWKSKKCKVVAFVYDAGATSLTQYEVLQAEEKIVE